MRCARLTRIDRAKIAKKKNRFEEKNILKSTAARGRIDRQYICLLFLLKFLLWIHCVLFKWSESAGPNEEWISFWKLPFKIWIGNDDNVFGFINETITDEMNEVNN